MYLLDDPISAVDVHVARHLFSHCIRGLLKHKTRLLCTHQIQFIEQADYVILMDNGRIIRTGFYFEKAFFSQLERNFEYLKVNQMKLCHQLKIYYQQIINHRQ